MNRAINVIAIAALVLGVQCSDDDDLVGPETSVTIPDAPEVVCTAVPLVDVSAANRVVGDGTPQSCTEEAIRAALSEGDTIRCDCGEAAPTIAVSQPFEIRKNTVFDGGGIVFDGGGSSNIFHKRCVSATQDGGISLTLQNMTLYNGRADTSGGAVRNGVFGSFTAINVDFLHNSCGVTAAPDVGGGAIYSIMQTKVLLSGCTFVGNRGSNGGAIGGIGNSMRIVNCVFDSNAATGHGGGKDAGPTGRGGIGGAIYIDNVNINGVNNSLEICGTVFRHNQSNAHGGALFAYFRPGEQSTGEINLCTFENNRETTSMAGAIYQQNGTFTIANSTFSGNRAVTQGGALWVYRDDSDRSLPVSITNCTFESNGLSGEWSMGGAITITSTTMYITNCTLAKNTARHFGCAIKNSGTLTLANTLLDSNLLSAGPNNNGWAGMAIDKNSTLTDADGNLCYPATFSEWGTDEWLENNPGVSREDPLLQPLADNGGPTRTMAIPAESPAVDQGNGSGCPETDQRGYSRSGTCDIGAFEYGAGQ